MGGLFKDVKKSFGKMHEDVIYYLAGNLENVIDSGTVIAN